MDEGVNRSRRGVTVTVGMKRREEGGEGQDRLVVERPSDTLKTADLEGGELREGGGGEVQVPLSAAHAAVGDLDGDGLALV